jgi:SAM-dependent methyltransferase
MTGSRYDSTRKAWENIWDTSSIEVELEAVQYRRSLATIRQYLPYLPKDQPILEAGSGLSAIVITLRRMGYPVIGLDYAVNALENSRAYDTTLPLLAGDVHALPFADNSLGAYLSFGVLEHFEAGMNVPLKEAYRVLRPGGSLVLTIPYPNVVNQLVAKRRAMQGESVLNQDDFYESSYSRAALVAEVGKVGFLPRIVAPTSHDYTLWGLGGVFRAAGYYRTSVIAELIGTGLSKTLKWAFNFMTLVVAQKE